MKQEIKKLIEENNQFKAAVWANNHKKAANILVANQIISNFKQVYKCVEVAKQELQKVYY